MRKFISLFLLLAVVSIFTSQPALAQAGGPVYIVQPGDTLSFIASRFNVTLEQILAANPTIDPNFLSAGQQIVIPGLEGITGILETEIIPFGETLRSLSRRTQVSDEQMKKLNRLISPTELYVGVSLIVPVQEGQNTLSTRLSASVGESLFELAIKQGSNPWTLASVNKLGGTWNTIPGDVLYSPTAGNEGNAVTGLPSAFLSASISPLPMTQGSTEVIRVITQGNVPASGMLIDNALHFFPANDEQIALQGVHALLEPGVYPLRVEATLSDGSKQSFEQMVLVTSGDYQEITISVSPEYLDPAVTEPELQQIVGIVSNVSQDKYWQDTFQIPVALPYCIKDWFGIRRTYLGIGSDITTNGWHSGVDYGICSESNPYDIYAPAAGKVVFSGPLTIRGNATIINHGWGVYSGMWHQKESLVVAGQDVTAGQLVGQIGDTGRVTGPHLHWEVWVNGIQVNPLDWLDQDYP